MTERLGIYSEAEVRAARELVRELIRVVRSFRLYEGNHPTLGEMQLKLRQKWDAATAGGALPLRLTERKVLLDEEALHQSVSPTDVVPCVLYEHGIVGIVLQRGLEPGEARRLVEVLSREPDPTVDYAAMLWDADLHHVQILIDADDLEDEEPLASPEEFADRLAKMGHPDDPAVGDDYDDEAMQLEAQVVQTGHVDPDQSESDRFALTEGEQLYIARMLESDHYLATVRHAARVVHALAAEVADPKDAAWIDKAMRALIDASAASSDLTGSLEMLKRGAELAERTDEPMRMRVGELTVALFREPSSLWTLLRGLDHLEYVDTRALGEFLARVGPEAAPTVGEWLLETKYLDVAARAMRIYGDAGAQTLIPLYRNSNASGRERLAAALLELGTPEALLALADEFARLPEASRYQILQLIGRNPDPSLRRVVYLALTDPVERIRQAALGALRRQDAPEISLLLPGFLEGGLVETLTAKDVEDFFEMLSRIGDAAVATALAEHCKPKGFLQGFRRLTPTQERCVRALRRMRSPDARAVVEQLRRSGPRAIRDILEDDFAL
jgi:hypothetical protein